MIPETPQTPQKILLVTPNQWNVAYIVKNNAPAREIMASRPNIMSSLSAEDVTGIVPLESPLPPK